MSKNILSWLRTSSHLTNPHQPPSPSPQHFAAARTVLEKAAAQCPELLVLSLATIGGMGRIKLGGLNPDGSVAAEPPSAANLRLHGRLMKELLPAYTAACISFLWSDDKAGFARLRDTCAAIVNGKKSSAAKELKDVCARAQKSKPSNLEARACVRASGRAGGRARACARKN